MARFLPLLFVATLLSRAAADLPRILAVNSNDPDDNDRVYSNGDTITLLFSVASDENSQFFVTNRQIQGVVSSNGQGVTLADKAAVDALVSFSVNLGAAYSGQWSLSGPFSQLMITVSDVTGADTELLQALNFTVSCVANQITLVGAGSGDSPCTVSYTHLTLPTICSV